MIEYINVNEKTEIIRFTGDHYKYYTEYIPFTIPEIHSDGNLSFHVIQDNTWGNKYRGVEIDYIKIITGSEFYMGNTTDPSDVFAETYKLQQNYPNPFNPSTDINFYVPHISPVSISIYNIQGKLIERLVDRIFKPGNYSVHLNAREYASGIYLYNMEVKNATYTKKFIIIK